MHNTVLSLGRTFDKSPSGHLGSRQRVGALLVAGLIASGVLQLPTSAVAATGLRTQDPSVTEAGARASVANPAPARTVNKRSVHDCSSTATRYLRVGMQSSS